MKRIIFFTLLLNHFSFITSLFAAEKESKEESVTLSTAVPSSLIVSAESSFDSLLLAPPRWRLSTEEEEGISLKVWGNNLFLKNYPKEDVPVVQIPITDGCLRKLDFINCLTIMDQAHQITHEGLEHFSMLTMLSLHSASNFKGIRSASLKSLSLSKSTLTSGSELLSPLANLDIIGDQTFTGESLPSTLESFSALLCPLIKGDHLPSSLTSLSIIDCETFIGESVSTLPFLLTLRVKDCPLFNMPHFLSQGFSSSLTKLEWSNNIPKEEVALVVAKISESVKKVRPLLNITLKLREAEKYYVLSMEGRRHTIEELSSPPALFS